ncbi:hypothetical protein [Alteribacillus iranensis]|uniref:Uncharacterized protein n=1 Tax=Alteribacillus iranensis TaxID=930128 RepID=A0A1I2BMA8_9BACI|nr:hypothetical protein [Alteribacillus iranensis]SFE57354.1 hypothetical protein SAMN05192532_102400 [Alteribacillus iranensis]
MKKKYMIIAVDQEGNEVGLEPYMEDEHRTGVYFESKEQACAFYDVMKTDLSPCSVKMLTVNP